MVPRGLPSPPLLWDLSSVPTEDGRRTNLDVSKVLFLRVTGMYPVIDRKTCNGCTNCVVICPSEVYRLEADKADPVHPEDCIECWACVNQCPTASIELHEE